MAPDDQPTSTALTIGNLNNIILAAFSKSIHLKLSKSQKMPKQDDIRLSLPLKTYAINFHWNVFSADF